MAEHPRGVVMTPHETMLCAVGAVIGVSLFTSIRHAIDAIREIAAYLRGTQIR